MKKFFALFIVVFLTLSGCSERLYQIEPPPSQRKTAEYAAVSAEETWLAADCDIYEREAELVAYSSEEERDADSLGNGFYTNSESFRRAAEKSGRQALLEQVGRYDDSFFELNNLCVISHTTSGGMQYICEGVTLDCSDGRNVLRVYASYSHSKMCNCYSDYVFFVKLAKAEVTEVDDMLLCTRCRDIL